ncbi:Blzf1p [Halocaridina rubra]|uniref:Blzf1p n=1 Tax=Halocaridina rubra TaxID=373956 RepID=A0AAN9AH23_HALRR
MKPSGAIRYPVEGVTLHRVAVGQRSQGDGEEQAGPIPPVIQDVADIDGKHYKPELIAKDLLGSFPEKFESSDGPLLKKESSNKSLPNIDDIAQKLTKVSIMSSPDSHLLNTPPLDIVTKTTYRLHPKHMTKSPIQATWNTSLNLQSQKRKEPRFIPYEPYKGCVRPIANKKGKKVKGKKGCEAVKKDSDRNTLDAEKSEKRSEERLGIIVQEFEREKTVWEQERDSLRLEKKSLEDQITSLKKDKSNLESHLNVQSQVNAELKKLLVASVGEDVQGRVQCLTEDKARMATMIRRYSEKVDKDYEEREKMGIQCDVWRSKFLGSSMLVDELASWKAVLTQRLDEAREALRMLMDEHDLARQHVLNTYKINKQLREAFDPLAVTSGGIPPLTSADLVTLAVDGSLLAQTVRDHLCGPLGRSLGCNISLDGLEFQTPGEKMALQLTGKLYGNDGFGSLECGTVSPGAAAMLQRFHPNTRYEHVTVNCCGHCNGEIKVL